MTHSTDPPISMKDARPFKKRIRRIVAKQVDHDFKFHHSTDFDLQCHQGDWLCRFEDTGEMFVVAEDQFPQIYEHDQETSRTG